jgi:hypothetical protein
MRRDITRLLLIVACLAFGLCFLGVPSPAAAADKKKAWASKKHKKTHHKSSKPKAAAAKAGGASGGAAAASAKADDEEEDDDNSASAEDDEKQDQAAPKGKAKASGDDGEREARNNDDEKGGGDDDEGDGSVVRRKAKRPVAEEGGGAPVAFELRAGPRGIHRSFNFNDPLSNHAQGVTPPYSYALGAGAAPFLDLGFYPGAFATRGFGANVGLVAKYERLVGTKTTAPNGASFDALAQQYEVGARGRLPLGDNELGLTASYGKQTFHVTQTDMGPTGTSVPNVDYSFVGLDLDGRLAVTSAVELGAHLGSRLVLDTGALGQTWFTTVKTTSIDAGAWFAIRLTRMFSGVAGVDFMRYAFNFNPVPTNNPVVAGGAVDQYISGYAALRITVPGS